MEFKYPIAECDVRESELPRLERFRERLSTWHEWLLDDEHSIWDQIHQMLWNEMLFWTINECRRLAEKGAPPNVGFNRDVVFFIDQSYAANQLLAIRKLTEANRGGDAISIPRLLDDMKANADLFTRELYVCNDGLPFDAEAVEKRVMEEWVAENQKNGGKTVRWGKRKGPNAWAPSRRTHENFDRLTGQVGKGQSRDDSLSSEIFDKTKSKLGICGAVNKVASKFIAHAADAASRGQLNDLNDRERTVTFAKIEACQRIICRVASYISGPILYFGGSDLIPIPQYDHLEHLDKAWLDSRNMDAIARYWKTRADRVEGWSQGSWEKLLNLPS